MGVDERLSGDLRRPVRGDRTPGCLVLAERLAWVVAVDRARRAEHEPGARLGDRGERVLEAPDVDLDVRPRVGDRGPDAGPCGEVDDDVRPGLEDRGPDRGPVAGVRLDEPEARLGERRAEVGELARPGVEGLERVDGRDRPAVGEQPVGEGAADEPGPAGDERASDLVAPRRLRSFGAGILARGRADSWCVPAPIPLVQRPRASGARGPVPILVQRGSPRLGTWRGAPRQGRSDFRW
jgi:hypothetical protein